MKKKIGIALASMLILTALLTTSYLSMSARTFDEPSPSPQGVYHWKIMLAQANCNVIIAGFLTDDFGYIPGSDFFLNCTCELPEPQPSQFVFTKINTTVIPTDIHYDKFIDEDKDPLTDPIIVPVDHPIPYFDPEYDYLIPEEPHTHYQHVEEGQGPFGNWIVVVEVREQPYNPDRPFFEWQIMMKTHGVNASFLGVLTKYDVPMPGTDFYLETVTDPDLQCQVVRTPYCNVPNDILAELWVNDTPYIAYDEGIKQFPWRKTIWIDPPFLYVELEVTEVQMYRYVMMMGDMDSSGQLPIAEWHMGDWVNQSGTPFATRVPYLVPLYTDYPLPTSVPPQTYGMNITFTQRDPISGIVKLGVPAPSYVGINHVWFGADTQVWFNLTITMETQGCGWIFTGIGKRPILGDVDLITYNDQLGVWSSITQQLLAGQLPSTHPAYPAAGAGPPVGPCLQELRGPDGIPGTADDPIGDGTIDPPGSSILYLPSKMDVYFWTGAAWSGMFASPWPQLQTTGQASDIVVDSINDDIEGDSASKLGEPWEFFAGLDHPEYTPSRVPWKHTKCNAYVRYVCAWSVINVNTAMGALDVIFYMDQKIVREDLLIADINCDEICDIGDIVLCAISFGAKDEGAGPDHIMGTGDDKPAADPNYNPRGDLMPAEGEVDIGDIVRIAIDFGKTLDTS